MLRMGQFEVVIERQEEFLSLVQQKYGTDPRESDVIDCFREIVVLTLGFIWIELKVLFFEYESSHVGAHRWVKSKMVCDQANTECD